MAEERRYKTLINYPFSGSDYEITFEFLARKFVVVVLVSSTGERKLLTVGDDYRFIDTTTIRLLAVGEHWATVEIYRFTSASDRLVDFVNGSILRGRDLNVSQIQSIHIAEEARDAVSAELQSTLAQVKELLAQAQQTAEEALNSKAYVKEVADGITEMQGKTLRVADTNLSLLPSAEQRANKLAAFNAQGDAIVVPADASSGTGLAIQLADAGVPGGAALIGHDGATLDKLLQGLRGVSVSRVTESGVGFANWPQGKMASLGGKVFMGFNFGAGHGGKTLHTYVISTGDGRQFNAPILVAAPTANEEATNWSLVEHEGTLLAIVRFRKDGGDTASIRHVIYRSDASGANWAAVKEINFVSDAGRPAVLYHQGLKLKNGKIVYGWHDSKGTLGYALLDPATWELEHRVLRPAASNTTPNGTIKQAEPTFLMRSDTGEVLITTRAQAGHTIESPQVWTASADFSSVSTSSDTGVPVDVNPLSGVITPGGKSVLYFYSERYTTATKKAGLFMLEVNLEDAFNRDFTRAKHTRLLDLIGGPRSAGATAGVQHAIRLGNRVLVGVASQVNNSTSKSDCFMVTLSWGDLPAVSTVVDSLVSSNTRGLTEVSYWGLGSYAPRIRMNGNSVLSMSAANLEIGTYGSGIGDRGVAIYSYDGSGSKTPAIYIRPQAADYGGKGAQVDINRDLRLLKDGTQIHLGKGSRIRISGTTKDVGASLLYHNKATGRVEIGTTSADLPLTVWSYSANGIEFARATGVGSQAAVNIRLTDSDGKTSTITGGGSVGGIAFSTPSRERALRIADNGNVHAEAGIVPGSYLVSELPSNVPAGTFVFARNGRKDGEEAGKGTGVPVFWDGKGWKNFYNNGTVEA